MVERRRWGIWIFGALWRIVGGEDVWMVERYT